LPKLATATLTPLTTVADEYTLTAPADVLSTSGSRDLVPALTTKPTAIITAKKKTSVPRLRASPEAVTVGDTPGFPRQVAQGSAQATAVPTETTVPKASGLTDHRSTVAMLPVSADRSYGVSAPEGHRPRDGVAAASQLRWAVGPNAGDSVLRVEDVRLLKGESRRDSGMTRGE
jgi:hypothetical protein